jgi:uncharacterized protein YjbI with pentapeptide repeats
MSERDTNTEEKHKEPRAWRPWIPLRRQPWRWVLWAVMLVITLVALGWLVVILYPGIWQEISGKRVATLIGIGVALTVIIVLLVLGGASLGWTGFRGKTLWDLLQLLIVPLVLVGIGFLFEMQQAERQQALEEQQQALEDRRAKTESELAEQRAQDEALQAYLDQMGSLLLENDLRAAEEGSEVRTLALARTITVLGRLKDPTHRTAVMAFLVEAELVQRVEGGRGPIIPLGGSNLSGANLGGADLRNADLGGANLHEARLDLADLRNADLSGANLRGAYLRYAQLHGARLSSDLGDADLSGANLSGAYLSGAFLERVDLSDANLSNADLIEADLRGAPLNGADLRGANLNRADLRGTEGVTKETLEQQAKSLRGATMAHGTIYPGRYAAREFEPAVSFEVGEGWALVAPQRTDATDALFIQSGHWPKRGDLSFFTPSRVFDPSSPSEPKEGPVPENADGWVSWFQSHPNLDTSKPLTVSVGDASGKQIDVTVTSKLDNYPRKVCGEQPCVLLYPSGESAKVIYEGWKERFIIVDVEGETVLINVAHTQTSKFDEFLPKAQKVLDSVEWKGG